MVPGDDTGRDFGKSVRPRKKHNKTGIAINLACNI